MIDLKGEEANKFIKRMLRKEKSKPTKKERELIKRLEENRSWFEKQDRIKTIKINGVKTKVLLPKGMDWDELPNEINTLDKPGRKILKEANHLMIKNNLTEKEWVRLNELNKILGRK